MIKNTNRMMRQYALVFTALIASACMGQWQHVGLPGKASTLGGVQTIDRVVYFHAKENAGAVYMSRDRGFSWGLVHYAPEGDSWKYAEQDGTTLVNFTIGEGQPRTLTYQPPTSPDWEVMQETVRDFMAIDPNILVAVVENQGQSAVRVSNLDGSNATIVFQPVAHMQVRLVGQDGQGRILVQTYTDDVDLAGQAGLYRSADNGFSWQHISDIREDLTGASSNADHSIFASNGLRFFRSFDDGANWEMEPVSFPYMGLTGSRVFNVGGGHVYFMVHEPDATNKCYLFESFDSGKSWHEVNEGISRHLVYGMARDEDGTLYAATSNGVYRLDVPSVVASVQEPGTAVKVFAYPVPARDHVIVNAGGAMITEVRMYDATGKEVMFLHNSDRPAVKVAVDELPTGAYLLRTVTNKGIGITRIVVE